MNKENKISQKMYDALCSKYTSQMLESEASLMVYFSNPVGIGEHPQHIASTLTKCFSCDFHFIKHYGTGHFATPAYQHITFNLYKSHQPTQLLDALVFISNKGPPMFA